MQSAVIFLLAVLVSGSHEQCISPNDNAKITDKTKYGFWQSSRHSFGVSIFQLLNKERSSENIIFSPSSLHNALLLAYFGAAKETEKSLANVLKISYSTRKADAWQFYKTEKLKNSKPGNTTNPLKIANKIYFSNRLHLRPCIQANLRTETELIDFTNVKLVENYINNWVASVTEGEIKDPVQYLDPNSTAVMVNAVVFKSHWLKKFFLNFTEEEPFHINSKETKNTNMMINLDNYVFGHLEDIKSRWLKLPFVDEKQAMIILLPDNDNDLDSVIGSLNFNVIQRLTNLAKFKIPEEVVVRIPKYKHRNRINFNSVLEKVGIGNAFNKYADYSRFTGKKEVSFSGVEQEALIEADEEGAKAVAATFVSLVPISSEPPPTPTFTCDRPYVYFIYDYVTNEILFLGTFRDPTDFQ